MIKIKIQIKQLLTILLMCLIPFGIISIGSVGMEQQLPESNSHIAKKILFDESHNTYWGGNPIFHAPYIINHPVTKEIDKISAGKGNPSSLKIITDSVQMLITGDEDSYSGYHNNYHKVGEKPPILAVTDYGKGRVVFLGHDGFFANADDDKNGKTNLYEYDNKKLALNIINWRSGPTPQTLSGDWPMFKHDAARTSASEEVVEPPLELLWKFKTTGGYNPSSSPAVSGGVVYVGSVDNHTYALDASIGSLKWKYETGRVISSPAVSGSVVYIGSFDNSVYALDASTGSLKWKYETDGPVYSSPVVSGSIVYIGSVDNHTYALDASTGNLKWKFKTDGFVVSSPAVSEGVVYVGSYDSYVYALDASTGNLKWKFKTGERVFSSPSVSGGVVYVGSEDNYTYSLDASIGNLKWKFKTDSIVLSSPAVSGGVVYVVSGDSYMYALDAKDGSLKWKYKPGGRRVCSPAVSGGVVYVGASEGDDHFLYALDASTGSLKWKYKTTNAISSSPVISEGVVYVVSAGYFVRDSYVYAFASVNNSKITPTPTAAPKNYQGPLIAKLEKPAWWDFWSLKALKIIIENPSESYVYIPKIIRDEENIKLKIKGIEVESEIKSYYKDNELGILTTVKDIYKEAKPVLTIVKIVVSPPHSLEELVFETATPAIIEKATDIDPFMVLTDAIGGLLKSDKGAAGLIFKNALIFEQSAFLYNSTETMGTDFYLPPGVTELGTSYPEGLVPVHHYQWKEKQMYFDLKKAGLHFDPMSPNSGGYYDYEKKYKLPKDKSVPYYILFPKMSLIFEIPYEKLENYEVNLEIEEYQALKPLSKQDLRDYPEFNQESWKMGGTIAYIKYENTFDGYNPQPLEYYSHEAIFKGKRTTIFNIFDFISIDNSLFNNIIPKTANGIVPYVTSEDIGYVDAFVPASNSKVGGRI